VAFMVPSEDNIIYWVPVVDIVGIIELGGGGEGAPRVDVPRM
jgi:hypothetical protein